MKGIILQAKGVVRKSYPKIWVEDCKIPALAGKSQLHPLINYNKSREYIKYILHINSRPYKIK